MLKSDVPVRHSQIKANKIWCRNAVASQSSSLEQNNNNDDWDWKKSAKSM